MLNSYRAIYNMTKLMTSKHNPNIDNKEKCKKKNNSRKNKQQKLSRRKNRKG